MLRLLLLPLLAAAMVIVLPMAAPGGSGADDTGRRAPAGNPSPSPCADGDIACRMRLAAEAVRDARVSDAEAIYRNILAANPLLDEPYQALLQLASNRPLSKDSQAYRTTLSLLDGTFHEYETRRFIVLSNANSQWTHSQAEHLERANHQFMRFANRLNLRPLPLKHKLVCVLFERQNDYRAFAEAHDEIRDQWIVGHYSPRHDRVVFFHRSDDEQDVSRQESIATTIHEAIHQLHFHTRVKSLNVQYPLWICEGLATAFETAAPNQAFGPDHEFAPRRDRFQLLLQREELIPLRELIAITSLDAGQQDNIAAMYHQSYAFVTWANRYRTAQLRDYLNAMLLEPPGKMDESRHVAIFTQTFGDIDTIERQWLNHERQSLAQRGSVELEGIADDPLPQHVCACHPSATVADNRLSYRLMAHARLLHQ